MITTFAVYVENKPGVLTRVASLFRRRAFNIESLTVGHTDKPGVSRMTIAVDTDELGGEVFGLVDGALVDTGRCSRPPGPRRRERYMRESDEHYRACPRLW